MIERTSVSGLTTRELLSNLRRAGVTLWVAGEALRYSAPHSFVTPELRSELAARKREIVQILSDAGDSLEPRAYAVPLRHEDALLSFAQQRLWFLHQLGPGSPLYNIHGALRLEGNLKVAALERSLMEIVRRHEILRTTYVSMDGQPRQRVSPPYPFSLPVTDLTSQPPGTREEAIWDLSGAEARKPFDLERGLPIRVRLLILSPFEHILLLSVHHIAFDAASSAIFIRELGALYDAFAAGRPSPLPDLPIQYADFALWERDQARQEMLETHLAFWRHALAGLPPRLQLAPAQAAGEWEEPPAAMYSFPIPSGLVKLLKALSTGANVTPFFTYLSAFLVLLARYTGQTDLAVGSPISGRVHPELEDLIGFLVNTVVLRVDLSGNPTLREALARVRETVLDGYEHGIVPFERLVGDLQPERNMNQTPLFQVMFAHQNAPAPVLRLHELTIVPLRVEPNSAMFDLSLVIEELAEEVNAHIEYRRDLFVPAFIQGFAGHFERILEGMVRDIDQRIWTVPILSPTEIQQFSAFNRTAARLPEQECVHQLFEERVAAAPNHTAAIHRGKSLTFAALDQQANQLAHLLQEIGVGPESIAGICLEPSLELPVAMLAVLKAGGAYLSLSPSYPKERLRHVFDDARPALLLTTTGLASALPECDFPIILMDEYERLIANYGIKPPRCSASGANIAYVIYTSGSTGRPKGVMVPHRSLLNHCVAAVSAYGIQPSDRVYQFASFSVDVAAEEIFPSWSAGAAVVFRASAVPPGVPDFLQELNDSEVTILNAPTPYWEQWMQWCNERDLPWPERLRMIVIGSDKPSGRAFEIWQSRAARGASLINAYGCSETTITNLMHRVAPPAAGEPCCPLTIGRPISNTTAYLLDDHLQQVPRGVAGELYVGGCCVARGYLNRPDLTAERFLPDPFGAADARMYRTGDLARLLPDGTLAYIGRTDFQIKLRGLRVEPGEIEAVLTECPGVREAAVLLRENAAGDARLIAFVSVHGSAPGPATLRRFASSKLPLHMVPAHFEFVEQLPRTPNGKVERAALGCMESTPASTPAESSSQDLPRTTEEATIADIWSELLGSAEFGVHDDFFSLGGHSLLAAQVIARMEDTFGIGLKLRTLFENPTVVSLAEKVRASSNARAPSAPIRRGADLSSYPLTVGQERFWELDAALPGTGLFNLYTAVRLLGALDPGVLKASVDALVKRHEVLRTTFEPIGGHPVQVVSTSMQPDFEIIDLRRHGGEACHAAQEQVARVAKKPFCLRDGPLGRFALIRLTETENILVVGLHHIIADGWSLNVLGRDLAALYAAGGEQRRAQLCDLPVRYCDYARWQRECLGSGRFEPQIDYWSRRLRGIPGRPSSLGGNPRPGIPTFKYSRRALPLSVDLCRVLRSRAASERASPFMFFAAALQWLVRQYSGGREAVIGTLTANRNRTEIENLAGLFLNTLVLRTDFSDLTDFRQVLREVRNTVLGAQENQDVPFEVVLEHLRLNGLCDARMFDVLLIFQNFPAAAIDLPHVQLLSVPMPAGEAEVLPTTFDLIVTVEENRDDFEVEIKYALDAFDAPAIKQLLRRFETILDAAARVPAAPLSEMT